VSRPDRHAQRNPQGPQHTPDQEQEQEIEVGTETQEPEHSRAQNQVGNQALADMLASRAKPDAGDREGGGGGLVQGQRGGEKEGQEYGGDDDPLEDAPLTIEELAASWNPTTKKAEDRPAFLEAMPDDDLPPEDDKWLAEVKRSPSPRLHHTRYPDGLLQPSALALAGSLGPWSREAARWLEPTLEHRCLGYTLAHPPPCLQDPHGRVLVARVRTAALATWALLDTRLLAGDVPIGTSAFLDFILETASGARHVREATRRVLAMGQKLPRAADLLDEMLPDNGRRVAPRPLPPEATARMVATLRDLTALEPARSVIPSLLTRPTPASHDDDDPLGLDAILAEHTGGPVDPDAAVYHAAVQGAERLAGSCARTRVAFVGAALAIGDACADWSTGVPATTLRMLATHVDQRVQETLQLLVEIARAAQRRSVPPKGLANGLRRGARQIEKIRRESFGALSQVAGAVLPGVPAVPGLPADHPSDPLETAWLDGHPADAIPWLRQQPERMDTSVALALVRAASAAPPHTLAQPLIDAAAHAEASGRPHLARALETVAGPCLLWADRADDAIALAERHIAVAQRRRNPVVLASAAMLAMEAHLNADRADQAEQVRLSAGQWCWHLGGFGAVSALARWAPSDD
jgi:hypothetical protein